MNKRLIEDKKVTPQIIEKGYKNKPLTDKQMVSNKEKSKTRVRVEHIYGFVGNSMNGQQFGYYLKPLLSLHFKID